MSVMSLSGSVQALWVYEYTRPGRRMTGLSLSDAAASLSKKLSASRFISQYFESIGTIVSDALKKTKFFFSSVDSARIRATLMHESRFSPSCDFS